MVREFYIDIMISVVQYQCCLMTSLGWKFPIFQSISRIFMGNGTGLDHGRWAGNGEKLQKWGGIFREQL